MRQGGGTEAKEEGRGRTVGELREGLSGLWKTFGEFDGVQISGKGDDGGGGRLAGSGRQPTKCEEELGEVVEYFEPGGGGPESIGSLFQGGSIGGVGFRGRYIGPDPPDLAGLVKLSA